MEEHAVGRASCQTGETWTTCHLDTGSRAAAQQLCGACESCMETMVHAAGDIPHCILQVWEVSSWAAGNVDGSLTWQRCVC